MTEKRFLSPGKNRIFCSKVLFFSTHRFSSTECGRFMQKVMHTFHSLFHRLVCSKFSLKFYLSPFSCPFPHFSPSESIHPCIFMQEISCIRNNIRKMQGRICAPAFSFTKFLPGWILWRRHSVPFRQYCPQDIHNRPGRRSWQHYHRKGSGAADTPAPPVSPQRPEYPAG